MVDRLLALRQAVRQDTPLVHCLTNHITINDCANILLAAGARPIMAEHPLEVRGITRGADALLLNLGNITDERIDSMGRSCRVAVRTGIPIVLDLVGVGCSRLRLRLAQKLIARYRPQIVKGNLGEINALRLGRTGSRGVDASAADLAADPRTVAQTARSMAADLGCVLLVSGPVDAVASATDAFLVRNGHPMLGRLTGTGCMLGALCAAFAGRGAPLDAALLAALLEGVAGEEAAGACAGVGSFKPAFFDAVCGLPDGYLQQKANMERMMFDEPL